MAFKPIQILINAKDDASAVFDKLQAKVAAVGAAILAFFGIKAFAGVVQGAADLEAGLSRVQAATGATAAEMVELRKAAEDAGANSQFTAVQAAGALENLAKAGLSAGDAIKTLPAVMNLAAAGDVDLATSAEYVTKAVNGLGLSFNDAGRVADVLAKGANATNTSVTGLAQALSYAAPLANTLGLSLEQTVAIIGKFADAGIDASRAGTALNSIMAQFSDPASKFRTELAASGITTTNFNDALHQLAKGGPGAERAINAVGTEAGPALRALLNQGIGKLDELTKSLKDAEGSAAAAAKVMQDNLNGSVKGLKSAWDTLPNALGTPILPVVTQGVRDLAGALKSAVSDGTAKKLGDALAAGFQSAIAWAKNFAASFDLPGLIAQLQDFATRAQQTFAEVGQHATNAGNIVKTVWGVMSAGANTVMAVVYKVAEAFAGVSRDIMSGLAELAEGLSKITFGGLAERFRAEAEQYREVAAGLTGVTDAYADKAEEAFSRAGASAELARSGVDGLSTSMQAGSGAADGHSKALSGVAAQLQAVAHANDAAATKERERATAQQEQAKRADAARQAQQALREEYTRAVENKDWQRAAELMQQLGKAAESAGDGVKSAAQKAKEAADEIAAAFQQAGIKTKADLQMQAETARRQYEIIRQSGQATSEGLQAAWKRAADAAIAANDGVAPAWVQAQASAQKYQVAIDEAGRATLKLVNTDLSGIASGLNNAAQAAGNYAQALAQAGAATPGIIDPSQKIKSTQVSGETRSAGTDLGSRTGVAAFLKAAGVSDDAAVRRITNEFADSQGNIPYFNNPGQKKYGGDGGTLSQALLKAAERYTFDGVGRRPDQGATIPKPESTRTVRVNLEVNGQGYGSINTDAAGADALDNLLAALESARSVARH